MDINKATSFAYLVFIRDCSGKQPDEYIRMFIRESSAKDHCEMMNDYCRVTGNFLYCYEKLPIHF